MPGRVDDVDQISVPFDGAMFGRDRNAALAFEFAAVHNALRDLSVFTERVGAAENGVDQRGLAVVDMSHDREISNFVY